MKSEKGTLPETPSGMSIPDSTLVAVCDRRSFLRTAALPCIATCASAFVGGPLAAPLLAAPAAENDAQFVREAQFYEKLAYKKIKCKLCPRECVIDDR